MKTMLKLFDVLGGVEVYLAADSILAVAENGEDAKMTIITFTVGERPDQIVVAQALDDFVDWWAAWDVNFNSIDLVVRPEDVEDDDLVLDTVDDEVDA